MFSNKFKGAKHIIVMPLNFSTSTLANVKWHSILIGVSRWLIVDSTILSELFSDAHRAILLDAVAPGKLPSNLEWERHEQKRLCFRLKLPGIGEGSAGR
jgi:hypothetical protein